MRYYCNTNENSQTTISNCAQGAILKYRKLNKFFKYCFYEMFQTLYFNYHYKH